MAHAASTSDTRICLSFLSFLFFSFLSYHVRYAATVSMGFTPCCSSPIATEVQASLYFVISLALLCIGAFGSSFSVDRVHPCNVTLRRLTQRRVDVFTPHSGSKGVTCCFAGMAVALLFWLLPSLGACRARACLFASCLLYYMDLWCMTLLLTSI